MKKLLMFLCCVFALNANIAWGAGECPYSTTFHLQGTQRPKDNEFLYTNETVWNKASTDGVRGSTVVDLRGTGGVVYECDQEQACGYGSYIEGGFVHKGEWVDGIFRCHYTIGDDKWTKQNPQECKDWMILNPSPSLSRVRFLSGGRDKVCFADNDLLWCCSGQKVSCLEAQKRGEPANWTQSGTCNCGDRHVWNPKTGHCEAKNDGGQAECPNQDEKKACLDKPNEAAWNEKTCKCACKDSSKSWDGKKCVKKDNNHNCGPDAEWKDGACQCKDPKKRWENGRCVDKTTPSCRDSRKTNVGKACCDITYAKYDATTDTCSCKTGEKFELYDTNHGRCIVVEGGNSDPTPTPNPVHVIYQCPMDIFSDWRTLYKDCEDVIAALDELELYCVSSARTEEGYTTRYTKLQQLRRACEQKANDRKHRITESTGIISNASKRLDELMANLKVTVWKNAEGNFNTARLASDSIAGVVLGTAGGLITSHLVKKGQVKAGFEDIQCTVGGQKVADWGDEFTVGIR